MALEQYVQLDTIHSVLFRPHCRYNDLYEVFAIEGLYLNEIHYLVEERHLEHILEGLRALKLPKDVPTKLFTSIVSGCLSTHLKYAR